MDRFPESWADVALISASATYRPPPAAYSIAMLGFRAVQHLFSHGQRPRLKGSPDDADGGVEIYYRSPSFQLTAGGMFLNSGHGWDEIDIAKKKAWAETARAQAVTLLPTRAMDVPGKSYLDVRFADLIRFNLGPTSPTLRARISPSKASPSIQAYTLDSPVAPTWLYRINGFRLRVSTGKGPGYFST